MRLNGYEADKGENAVRATIASGLKAGAASPHDDLPDQGIALEDFVAFMPSHSYIYTPCREAWPAGSVNAKLGKMTVTDADGELQGDPRQRLARSSPLGRADDLGARASRC